MSSSLTRRSGVFTRSVLSRSSFPSCPSPLSSFPLKSSHHHDNNNLSSTATPLLLHHTQRRSFGLLSRLFGFKRELETYSETGRSVMMNSSDIAVENETDSAFINVSLSIKKDFAPRFDASNHVIIKQFGSCLSIYDFPGITVKPEMLENQSGGSELAPVVGKAFAGTIVHIPEQVARKMGAYSRAQGKEDFKVGDRVWGVAQMPFGQQWADLAPVEFRNLHSAPDNIPLHLCGMLPVSILTFYQCMRQLRFSNFAQFAGKKVLFIGSGTKSLVNIGLPIFIENEASCVDILLSSERHGKVLKEHFDNLSDDNCVLYEQLGVENESNELELECDIEFEKYDIVIDSIAIDEKLFNSHMRFLTKGGTYWVQHTPIPQILASSKSKMKAAMEIAQFMNRIQTNAKTMGIKSCMGSLPRNEGTVLHDWASCVRDVAGPIVLDKMYSLDDVQHALNYVFDNDDSILGENVGILVNKEEDFECADESVVWYPVELDDIKPYMAEKKRLTELEEMEQNEEEVDEDDDDDVEEYYDSEKTEDVESEDASQNREETSKNVKTL